VSEGLFDPAALPAPRLLCRRHLALVLVDETLGGQQGRLLCFRLQTSAGGGELLWYEDGSGNEYGLVPDGDDACCGCSTMSAPTRRGRSTTSRRTGRGCSTASRRPSPRTSPLPTAPRRAASAPAPPSVPSERTPRVAVTALVERGEPVTEAALAALAPVDGAAAMLSRAGQLGLV
jgi:hypothetical protein